MFGKDVLRASAAAVAATAGIGFASGRRMTMFFSQTGCASWTGVLVSSIIFGAVCGGIRFFADKTGAKSFYGMCVRLTGATVGRILGVMHGAVLCVAAVMMLAQAGRLAELALPVHHAFAMGILFSLTAALLMCMRGMRGAVRLCGWTVGICFLFYTALLLDPRDVVIRQRYVTEAALSGSFGAAMLLGALFASLCACIAGGMCVSARNVRPLDFAMSCGGWMLLMLALANGVILKGGENLLFQPMPYVILAARWGKTGYYACILAEGTGALATLSAALGALAGAHTKTGES